MNATNENRIGALLERGIHIPVPQSVEIAADVPLESIAPGVKLYAGTRLRGKRTSIGPECEIGREAPATIENCQLGRKVHLKGGYFADAVFLDGAAMGSGAHVRGGTLLEEGAEMAHCAALKQSILFPFVVGGSLINFCDVLMAGGTDRKNHSEIGSSYIHFNYTPHGDKATASLIGDVPHGVLLDQPAVFLGGQGGMVGPRRVAFGTVIAAGGILRKDVPAPGQLVVPAALHECQAPYSTAYRSISRTVGNCVLYYANIVALKAWYTTVRQPMMAQDIFSKACYDGAIQQLDAILDERLKRLDAVLQKVARQDDSTLDGALQAEHRFYLSQWPALQEKLAAAKSALTDAGADARDAFLRAWNAQSEPGYIARIQSLSPTAKSAATRWLSAIIDTLALSQNET